MLKYAGKRVLLAIPVFIGVIIIVFTLLYISPGDPATIILGESATEENIANLRAALGTDRPYIVQLIDYIRGVFTLDFGTSYRSGRPVLEEILERFPTTALLAFLSIVIAGTFGVVTGIVSATRQYSWLDRLATGVALFGVSMPAFWQALMLILIFSLWLGWLPASGSYGWQYWILPTVTLGTESMATIMRMTRSSMLESIRQDYVRTARAKGQTEFKVVMSHALRNSLIPILTVLGIRFGALLGGAIFTETVFSLNGTGQYMVQAINLKDYPAVQGTVLFTAAIFTIVNLLVDILYGIADPRLRSMYTAKKVKKAKKAGETDG